MILTAENYYSQEANEEYMSVSQYKEFEKCEACALAQINGLWTRSKTTALLVGSLVDAHFSGEFYRFLSDNPEVFKKGGEVFKKVGEVFKQCGEFKKEYAHALDIIAAIEADPLMMQYFSGDTQAIMTGEIAGVKVKIKTDFLQPDKIVDMKIMRDFNPIYKHEQGRLNFIEAWRCDLQGAVYQEIVRQNTGAKLPFYIGAASKEEVPDKLIVQVPQELLDTELDAFKETVPYYDALKKGVFEPERCEKCAYCRSTKKLDRLMTWEELCAYDNSN